MAWRQLSKQQWEAIRVHLPQRKPSARGGRPRVDDRRCFEGILWILWTGAQWRELPRRYGSPSTCWRRLRPWEETGVLRKLWRAFLAQLNDQQKLRWDECVADGRFIPAKKGDPRSGSPSAARARSGWFWSMARVLRWEHTWRRRPRRRLPSWSTRSTGSRAGGRGSLDAPASGPTACLRIAAMIVTRCGRAWLGVVSTRLFLHDGTTSGRRIKMGASCGATGGGGSWSAHSPGLAISAVW
jgi:transposase